MLAGENFAFEYHFADGKPVAQDMGEGAARERVCRQSPYRILEIRGLLMMPRLRNSGIRRFKLPSLR